MTRSQITSSFAIVTMTTIFFFFATSLFAAEKTYHRIVSLAPSVTEVLYAVGAGDRVVGVTSFCEQPPEVKTKPKIGGYTEHNIEAVMALRPDLVILAPNRGSKFTYEKLKQLHVDSLVVPFDNLEDLIQAFILIGDKIGLSHQARQAQAPLVAAVERVKSQASEIKGKKVVFVNWHTPFIVAGENSLEDDLIHLAGGVNVAHKSRDRYPRWNIEALFEYDPDMIIDAGRHGEAATLEVQRQSAREFWTPLKTLRAVKNGDIYIFKENVYSIAGPRTVRLIEAVNAMMKSNKDEKSEFYEQVRL